jgi:hypothetical protein
VNRRVPAIDSSKLITARSIRISTLIGHVAAVLAAATTLPAPDAGLSQITKDVADIIAKAVTAVGLLLTALTLYLNVRTRRQDLRWRMATAARDVLTDIHEHPDAHKAVDMIDCVLAGSAYTLEIPPGKTNRIELRHIRAALSPPTTEQTAGQPLDADVVASVRRAFDWFLYYLDRLSYLTEQGMLEIEDVAAPLAPYAKFFQAERDYVVPIMTRQNYLALQRQLPNLAGGARRSS